MSTLSTLPLAVALTERSGWGERIVYQVNGLIVVFAALASIWLVLEIIGWLFRGNKQPAPPPGEVPAQAAAPVAVAVPPEIIAVVTAAVHVTFGVQVRIAAVVPVPVTPWAQEGRRDIFTSHHIR